MEAVRVQRGLTYGIGVGLDTLFGGGVITGAFATENARVAEALEVTKTVWRDLAARGADGGGAGRGGRLPHRLPAAAIHRQRRIASTLLAMRRNNRAIDWLDGRNDRLRAITREKATQVAGALLRPDAIAVIIAGSAAGHVAARRADRAPPTDRAAARRQRTRRDTGRPLRCAQDGADQGRR